MLYQHWDNPHNTYRLLTLSRNASEPEATLVTYQDIVTGETFTMDSMWFYGNVYEDIPDNPDDALDTTGVEISRRRFVAVDQP